MKEDVTLKDIAEWAEMIRECKVQVANDRVVIIENVYEMEKKKLFDIMVMISQNDLEILGLFDREEGTIVISYE